MFVSSITEEGVPTTPLGACEPCWFEPTGVLCVGVKIAPQGELLFRCCKPNNECCIYHTIGVL